MVSFFLVIFLFAAAQGQQPSRQECIADEFPCGNGQCVPRYLWCDTVEDCSDGSDESFCYGVLCMENHFKCKNGMCIPVLGRCDNYADCVDGSDEQDCGVLQLGNSSDVEMLNPRRSLKLDVEFKQATAKAAEYLIKKSSSEDGWGTFTPRAIVALSFVDKISPIGKEKMELFMKQLNIQLLLDLLKKETKPNLSNLALYVNALYATCQDPRDFNGMDLVALLRSEADNAMKSDFNVPIALLTLCIADEGKTEDAYKLTEIYSKNGNTAFLGTKSLAVMAMICYGRKKNVMVQNYVDHFFATNYLGAEITDIYSRALFVQAANAAGYETEDRKLTAHQLSDGSFGDLLSTYYAIPALLHSSLLDMKCNDTKQEAPSSSGTRMEGNTGKEVTYSLWITSDKGVNTHSMLLTYEGNKTFYDVMKMAAGRDPLYSFSYDETSDGKKIYGLAGIPNDAEIGKSWLLYNGIVDQVTVNSTEYLSEKMLGVDRIFPEDKSHFVFWLRR